MEPIAIVGMSCRFPGAENPREFWRLLAEGRDAIGEIPADRWNTDQFHDPDPAAAGKMYVRQGGFLPQIDAFDPQAFGIAPREARRMDPQQRLMLELAWESLEDAGLPADRLAGTAVGVFVGFGVVENLLEQLREPATIDEYTITGNVPCVIANRISYAFDFRGPSIAIDTACSSSLSAVHLACRSLQSGESHVALAGGVSLMLSPLMSIGFSRLRALAPDGRSKAFDASADGYARGEGGGLVVLKRLADAVAAGDRVYAVICGSAINQDGRTNGLTAPNRFSQEAVLRAAYADAGIEPSSVQAIEAHGTGTLLGDPIEAAALGAVVGRGRQPDAPCLIGSVKSNIGHLEAAAGVAGIIKTALALGARCVPASLHYRVPNPHIPLEKLGLRVAQQSTAWPAPAGPARAGVSAFGFGGANAHVVLEAAPADAARHKPTRAEARAQLLVLSARSEAALAALANAYRQFLADDETGRREHLAAICHAAATRRTHHTYRVALVGQSHAEMAESLEAISCGQSSVNGATGRVPPAGPPQAQPMLPDATTGDDAWKQSLVSVARLWVQGVDIAWDRLFGAMAISSPARPMPLPTYPFQRQPMAAPKSTAAAATQPPRLLPSVRRAHAAIPLFQSALSAERFPFLLDHRVGGTAVLPGSALIEMALAAGRELAPGTSIGIGDLAFERFLPLDGHTAELQLTVEDPTAQTFGIHAGRESAAVAGAGWTRHARGRFLRLPNGKAQARQTEFPETIARRLVGEMLPSQFYSRLDDLGLHYGDAFRAVERIWHAEGESLGQIALPRALRNTEIAWTLHPALLDCCLQVAAAALPAQAVGQARLLVPVRIGEVRWHAPAGDRVWSHVTLCREAIDGHPTIDVRVLDESGQVLAELLRVQLQPVTDADSTSDQAEDEATEEPSSGEALPTLAVLSPLTVVERRALLEPFLARRVARELEIDHAQLDVDEPLANLGLDSLLVFKLAAQLHAELDLPISLADLADGPSVVEYTGRLLARLPN